jgi:NAD-dependent dihydropyrimidine dehydrogenase PreA subunit
MSFEIDFDDAGDDAGSQGEFDKIDRGEQGSQQVRRTVIRIDYDLCENSAVCAAVCPEDVLDASASHVRVAKPEQCTECWICVENCASGAIEVG